MIAPSIPLQCRSALTLPHWSVAKHNCLCSQTDYILFMFHADNRVNSVTADVVLDAKMTSAPPAPPGSSCFHIHYKAHTMCCVGTAVSEKTQADGGMSLFRGPFLV